MYSFARKILFKLEPELSHKVALGYLNEIFYAGLLRLWLNPPEGTPISIMGLNFPNKVGLAAGLDKNGDYIDGLSGLGFGFIEIGTITPRPQAGNPKPRLFRLAEAQAIINRMGFNNAGVDALLNNVAKAQFKGILGINIGKNADTPLEKAVDDYQICLKKVYAAASYITVNISSPNTKGLRQLQQGNEFEQLLNSLKETQAQLAQQQGIYKPLVVKIAPDLNDEAVQWMAEQLIKYQIDGVIATNTTLSRQGVEGLAHAEETGGLSGAPLTQASTEIVRKLAIALQGKLPIIAAGGILSAADAQAKLAAGASLVQVYSGLIYRGPLLVKELLQQL